jgi:hypothetical protein
VSIWRAPRHPTFFHEKGLRKIRVARISDARHGAGNCRGLVNPASVSQPAISSNEYQFEPRQPPDHVDAEFTPQTVAKAQKTVTYIVP